MASTIFNLGKTAKPRDPYYQTGKAALLNIRGRLQVVVASAAIGDIYVLAEGLSLADRVDAVIAKATSGALTAATSNDIGFYKYNNLGVLVPVKASGGNELISAADYSAGLTANTDLIIGITDVNSTKSIGEMFSPVLGPDAEPIGGVVLGLRTNVAPTTTNRTLDIQVVIEEATRN